jgi:formylglycine-generating enzyme required for sulfatase activity
MKTIVHSLGIQSIACKSRIACQVSILLAILIPAVFAAVPASLITNGGFENGLNAWSATGNVKIRSSAPYTAAEGVRLIAFNSGNTAADGMLSQTFPSIGGRVYRLDFAVGVLSYQNASQRIGVTVNGATNLLSRSISIAGRSGGEVSWVQYSYYFTADRNSVTLSFRDLSHAIKGIDLLLDDVAVTLRNVHTLAVESMFFPGVPVTVHPPDLSGLAGGTTRWSRVYEHGTKVDLTVPASVIMVMAPYKTATVRFQEWQMDGVPHDSNRSTSVIVNADHVLVPVYVTGPPIITMQPADLTVELGASATFSVTVDAPGTHYVWRHNGIPIDGAYYSTLTIPDVGAEEAGTYDVLIRDFGGAVTSRAATLQVIAPPFGNGGFENGSEGWRVTGNVRFIAAPLYPPREGQTVANFNAGDSEPNGVLSQTFATVPGRSYVLTFDVGILSHVSLKQMMEIGISTAGAGPWLFSEQAKGSGAVQWFEMMIPFTANGDPTVVKFRDTSDATRSIDMLLDDVSLTEIPSEFALVFPGSFEMGGREGEIGHGYGEDLHMVSFTRHLLVRKTELTWQEWTAVRALAPSRGYHDMPAGRNGFSGGPTGGPEGYHPVTEVNWWDAAKWCNLKSEMEGLTPVYYTASAFEPAKILRNGMPVTYIDWNADGYRLPTESEWENFCRAGSTTGFFTGPMLYLHGEPEPFLDMAGWYSGNSSNTHRVGQKQANAWGIHDTHGNVWEWCSDWFEEIYPAGPVVDPRGPAKGTERIIRGGSFHMTAYWCRSAQRGWHLPEARYWYLGFRPVRTLTR